MMLPRKKREEMSATLTQTLGLILACCGLFALTAYASPPAWWTVRGAVRSPIVTTKNGVVTTNYVANDKALVTQGQLKQFTARAVDEFNANLPGGAGTNLNTIMSNWAADYATNNYNATNLNPSDYSIMNIGQLKYIGNKVWAPLVGAGYTNAAPTWLQQNTNTDNVKAVLGQLKEVFDFDLSTWSGSTGAALQITSPASVTAAVGFAFSYSITASSSPTGYSATGLPAGLSVNKTTGVISGTPTTAGIYNVTIGASNSSGTGTGDVVIEVLSSSSSPVIDSPATMTATTGSTLAYRISASNGPTQYGATSLPTGLTVDSGSGVVSGTVAAAGTYTINLTASNSAGAGTATLNLTVTAASTLVPYPVLTSAMSVSASVGTAFSYTIAASNSPTTLAATSLPSWLSFNAATGVLSGTPVTAETDLISISATNAGGTASAVLTLQVSTSSAAITSATTISGAQGAFIDYFVTANNAPTSFTATGLPSGLSIDTTNGEIYGTPTTQGSSTATVTAVNGSSTASGIVTFTVVSGAPVITSSSTVTATQGSGFLFVVSANNYATSYASTGLPAGLTISATTGLISGTPTALGTSTVTLNATNTYGTGTATLTLTVNPVGAPALTVPSVLFCTEGTAYTSPALADSTTTSFSVTGLPSGMSYSSTAFTISGTAPSSVGEYVLNISATNAAGTTIAQTVLVVQSTTTVTLSSSIVLAVPTTSNSPFGSVSIENDNDGDYTSFYEDDFLYVGGDVDYIDRTLLSFDLSSLPGDAQITGVSLQMTENTGADITPTDPIDLYQPTGAFIPQTASWTANNGYSTNLLGSASLSSGTMTWNSTSGSPHYFLSAAQTAVEGGTPLYLMLVDTYGEAHLGTTDDAFYDESDPNQSNHPQLSITYTTAAPPIVLAVPDQAAVTGVPITPIQFHYFANGSTNMGLITTLPSGLTYNSATQTIAGTPNTAGNYTITFGGSNANGTGTISFTINVGNVPSITSSTTASGTVGSSFSYTTTIGSGSATYSATGLPPGLSIDPNTGIISGTAISSGSYSVTVIATNTSGSSHITLTVTVADVAPVIDGNGTINFYGNQRLAFSAYIGTSSTSTTTFASSDIPSWLTLTGSSNVVSITGTPPVSSTATYTFHVTATNSAGTSVPTTVVVNVAGSPVPQINPASFEGVAGVSFSGSANYGWLPALGANSVAPSVTWTSSLTGTVDGLSFSAGSVSGLPTSAATLSPTMTVSDSYGSTSETVPITIAASGPVITSSLSSSVLVGSTFGYSLQTADSAGTVTSTSVTLPTGLTGFIYQPGANGTGVLSGIPTTPGIYDLTLSATDSNSVTSTATLVLTVTTITSSLSATAQVGQPFTYSIAAGGNITGFNAVNLPPGLSVNSATGVISGTPLAADDVPITISATNGQGTGQAILNLVITASSSDTSLSFQQGFSPTTSYTAPSVVVANDSANAAVQTTTYNTGSVLNVGVTSTTAVSRALLDFDLSLLPSNATITSVTLVMNASSSTSSGAPLSIELHPAAASFDPTSTNWAYNNSYSPTLLGWLTMNPATVSSATFNGTAAFTALVQQAYNSSLPVNLMLLAPAVEAAVNAGTATSADDIGFATRASTAAQNPELIVTYTLGNPTLSPVITSAGTVTGRMGQSFSYAITATNRPTSFSSGTLPAGLTLNSGGTILGTPTAVGSTQVTVNATNAIGTGSKVVTFNIDNATPATGLTMIDGNNQIGLPNGLAATELNVRASNSSGVLANALVTFTAQPGQGGFSSSTSGTASSSLTVVTNGSGEALVYYKMPATLGTVKVTASSGTAAPVVFTETAVFSVPSGETDAGEGSNLPMLSVISGQGQSAPVNSVLAQPFVIQALDRLGQPDAGLPLTLNVTEGGGGICAAPTGTFTSTGSFTTDSNGQAIIYLKVGAGGTNGANIVSCTTSTILGEAPTVYLAAATSSATGSTVSPGGVANFQTDDDPVPLQPVSGLTPTNPDMFMAPDETYLPDMTKLTLTWTASPTADATYWVQRSTDYGTTWNTITETSSTQVKDQNLLAGIHYLYRVTAVGAGRFSSPETIPYEVPMVKFLQGTLPGDISDLAGNEDLEFGHFNNIDLNGYLLAFNPALPNSTFTWFTAYEAGSTIANPAPSAYQTNQSVSANLPFSQTFAIKGIQAGAALDFIVGAKMGASDYTGSLGLYGENNGVIKLGNPATIVPSCYIGDNQDPRAGTQHIRWTVNSTKPDAFLVLDSSGTPQTNGVSGITFHPGGNFPLEYGPVLGTEPYSVAANPADLPAPGDSISFETVASDGKGRFLGIDTATFTYADNSSPQDYSMSLDEAAGPKYRKIALNGLPMPDEKPQETAETDQEQEQTYVDALTLGVRHSTTDVYLPVSGSDFSLSARRDFRSQVWSYRNGLRPYEQPDEPFGPCWSTDLCANVAFTHSSDPNKTEPDQAIVTDETGAVHTFLLAGTVYFPMPTAKNEQQTPNLETLTVSTTTPPTYTFTRKYGTTLTFQGGPTTSSVGNDRVLGSDYSTSYTYTRLVQAVDRLGNTVNYNYANGTNLIPESISVANQPNLKISIQQGRMTGETSTDSREYITAIWDANGNETTYGYTANTATGGTKPIYELTSVTAPDGAVTNYDYEIDPETDRAPHPAGDPGNTFWHMDLKSVTDPNGHSYGFSYANDEGTQVFDQTKYNYMSNPSLYIGYYPMCGQPRNITKITMPDGTNSSFVNQSNIRIAFDTSNHPYLLGTRQNQVTDATGFIRTYRFINAAVFPLPQLKILYNSDSISDSTMVCYQTMAIDYGTPGTGNYLGTEQFSFDPNSAMALSQTTDLSGNTTTYAHADTWTASAAYQTVMTNFTTAGFNGKYGDPTSATDALGDLKTFTYSAGSRIMTSVTTNRPSAGNSGYQTTTTYSLDNLQRRYKEIDSDSSGNVAQEIDWTYDTTFPGFIDTKTIAKKSSDTSGAVSLVTQYVPDRNGRVAQEIVDPGGLNLVTSYTYDAEGNKLTATDPKGNTTWFSYDTRNRLTTVTNADGSQKQMVYDARGNKTIDYDENGHATLYAYDSLNRLITQARDMNGNAVNDGRSTDLVTSYTYNAANSKLSVTDPDNHTTAMAYDNLQRVTSITDPLSHQTTFVYGANSGGNAFDSSSFKPTSTTDPRSYVTHVTYDALYRPTIKSVQVDASGTQSVTSTQYDAVGNIVLIVDPLGHQTSTTYDALNRPLVTTLPDQSTIQDAYTSTGLKWEVTDELGRVTQSQYDSAGRPKEIIEPSVANGLSGTANPTTTTVYDAAGNVASTIRQVLGGGATEQWDNVYDARNRKVQELSPAVADASSGGAVSRPTTITAYDAVGNVIAKTDARGNTTTLAYDPANRVTTTTQPVVTEASGGSAAPVTTTAYDEDGNVTSVTDPNSHATTNMYDALNRLLTTTDAASDVVTNSYDQVGNKLSVQDGNLHTTSFAYDGLNRNTTVTDAAGHVTQMRYDAMNKTQRIDALGHVTSYLYDVRNRLSNVVYASGSAANSQRNYAYDLVGNLLSVTEPSKTAANVAYGYDALNRVTSETSGGLTHTYAYDLVGNRLQTVYGGTGRTITSTYDTLDRLSSMTESGRTTSYGYDLNGNICQKTLPNGDSETTSFDALNRDTVQSTQTGGAVSLYDFMYGYDLAGNLVSDAETYPGGLADRTVINTYDAIDRLTQEAVTSSVNVTTNYTYDSANNRLTKAVTGGSGAGSTSYSYNNLNQLTGYTNGTRSVALTYDLDGNRISRIVTGGSDNGTDSYNYDFENRLIGLVKGTSGGAGTYVYTYDYRTRRIVRDESSAGGSVTNLVFSGGTSVQEYTGSITSSNLTVEYLRGSDYGGGVGGILYSLRGGTPSYTHANKRGDIVAKTNTSGTLTYQAQYEAFGNQVATSGSTLDRQKSNSKDTDPTGLVDEGMRYRDLETGMFINRDPAGFVDGPNLYTYVLQNPWSSFDPEGLDTEKQHQADEDQHNAHEKQVEQKYWKDNPNHPKDPSKDKKLQGLISADEKAIKSDQKAIDRIEATQKWINEQADLYLDVYGSKSEFWEMARERATHLDDQKDGDIMAEVNGAQWAMAATVFTPGGEEESAGKGVLGGEIVSQATLDRLQKILRKNNCELIRNDDEFLDSQKADGIFMFDKASGDDLSAIMIRSDVTKFELYHELKHFGDFKRLGPAAFSNLGEYGKEKSVYEYLMKQTCWTNAERARATDYFNSIPK